MRKFARSSAAKPRRRDAREVKAAEAPMDSEGTAATYTTAPRTTGLSVPGTEPRGEKRESSKACWATMDT